MNTKSELKGKNRNESERKGVKIQKRMKKRREAQLVLHYHSIFIPLCLPAICYTHLSIKFVLFLWLCFGIQPFKNLKNQERRWNSSMHVCSKTRVNRKMDWNSFLIFTPSFPWGCAKSKHGKDYTNRCGVCMCMIISILSGEMYVMFGNISLGLLLFILIKTHTA